LAAALMLFATRRRVRAAGGRHQARRFLRAQNRCVDRGALAGVTLLNKRDTSFAREKPIPTIGVPGSRPILLTSTVVVLVGLVGLAWQHEHRLGAPPQVNPTSPKPEPRALSAEEESYAASLWEIHREVTPSAVAMSFAGIFYETGSRDKGQLERKISPVAAFFKGAETRVRGLTVPPSLLQVHNQYVEAMVLYGRASHDMLEFAKDGERQHLIDAHDLRLAASQAILRAGEVLWPGQYKPH
jgi:hypothetical protein